MFAICSNFCFFWKNTQIPSSPKKCLHRPTITLIAISRSYSNSTRGYMNRVGLYGTLQLHQSLTISSPNDFKASELFGLRRHRPLWWRTRIWHAGATRTRFGCVCASAERRRVVTPCPRPRRCRSRPLRRVWAAWERGRGSPRGPAELPWRFGERRAAATSGLRRATVCCSAPRPSWAEESASVTWFGSLESWSRL